MRKTIMTLMDADYVHTQVGPIPRLAISAEGSAQLLELETLVRLQFPFRESPFSRLETHGEGAARHTGG